ncbi:MAG TPA: hypothetical protein DEA08_18510 [Planctomycetes bacterium]|nr:hypothetical protein [Planctomycetota bacterium]
MSESDELDLYGRSKAEVEDLHRCLFEWCAGKVLGDNTPAWERIRASWATGFRLADSEGLVEGSKRLLALQVRFNEAVDDPLQAVWVESFTGYQVGEGLFQAFYEEWQRRVSGAEQGRAWSVLLREAGEGPFGLEWVHAHRSPLAASASPSFRPQEAYGPPPVAEPEHEGEDADEDDAEPSDVPWAQAPDLEGVDDAPWSKLDEPPVAEPPPPPAGLSPLTEIRAFFGDEAAQAEVGSAPFPFDQHDPERWLQVLRKGGPEAVLRAGLVVLSNLVDAWDAFFPEESLPGEILAALTRYQDEGDADALAEAKALAPDADELSKVAREFEPEGELPEGYREFVQLANAADAASRLAQGAGGSALGLGIKLAPVLTALSQETRLGLRPAVLAAFSESVDEV